MLRRLTCFVAVLLPAPLWAHEGHGFTEPTSIWHWLLEFEHSGWLLPALVVLIAVYWKKRA